MPLQVGVGQQGVGLVSRLECLARWMQLLLLEASTAGLVGQH